MRLACVAVAVLLRAGVVPSAPSSHLATAASVNATDARGPYDLTAATPIRCGGRTVFFPSSMVLIGGRALWCPNAKVATTSTWHLLRGEAEAVQEGTAAPLQRCSDRSGCSADWHARGLESVYQVPPARQQQVCNAFSFSFVRNPWDRVLSAYTNKIGTAHGGTPRRGVGDAMGAMSFAAFVREVAASPTANVHWAPFNARCRTSTFDYSFIGKLEDDFDGALANVFRASGISGGLRSGIYVANASHAREPASRSLAAVPSASEQQAEALRAAQTCRSSDARVARREPAAPIVVPHDQNSRYASQYSERANAYLHAEGLRYPRELVDLVAQTYAEDVAEFGYSFED